MRRSVESVAAGLCAHVAVCMGWYLLMMLFIALGWRSVEEVARSSNAMLAVVLSLEGGLAGGLVAALIAHRLRLLHAATIGAVVLVLGFVVPHVDWMAPIAWVFSGRAIVAVPAVLIGGAVQPWLLPKSLLAPVVA